MAKFEYMQRAFSSELKPRARLVLQVLVLNCNKEGECFPSIKAIAAKCGYGVSTVKRALDELVKAGYIVKQGRFDERKNGGQTSNLYTLCSDLPCTDEPENAPVPEDDSSDESPAVQPESAPADACNAPDPTPGEQSVTLPTADSYSFADGFETKTGRQKLPTHKDNISNYRSSSIEKATDSELFRVSGFSLKTRLHSGTIYVYKRNFS